MNRVCAREGCNASLAEMRVDAVWCSRACAMRAQRAARANKARTRPGRSGRQISYRKAVNAVASELERLAPAGTSLPDVWARGRATRILHDCLPQRQRA